MRNPAAVVSVLRITLPSLVRHKKKSACCSAGLPSSSTQYRKVSVTMRSASRRWHDAPVKPGRCCMAGHASSLAEPSAPGNRKPEFGEKAMLQQHRPGVLLCLERAGECERLAELAGDSRSRETYVRMASQWRAHAAPREVVEQIEGLLTACG